jgi:hypothetical protein
MSQDPKLSRRDFLKLTLTSLTATFLAACGRALGISATSSPTLTPTASRTDTPQPTATDTPTATSTPTETPSPTPIPCFKLLTPENGTKLPAIGKVTFSWEAMPGATRYQLQITLPSGQVVPFDVEGTSSTRYLESFLTAGIYQWFVIAFDSYGTAICSAEPFTFEKEQAPAQNNSGGNGGNNCNPWHPGCPVPTDTMGGGGG